MKLSCIQGEIHQRFYLPKITKQRRVHMYLQLLPLTQENMNCLNFIIRFRCTELCSTFISTIVCTLHSSFERIQ